MSDLHQKPLKPWQKLQVSQFRYYADRKQSKKKESFGCVVCCASRQRKSIFCRRHAKRYPRKEVFNG